MAVLLPPWYQTSADGLGAIAVNSYMLCKWPLLILYATIARIQRGQETDTRWTMQPPHALCRAELAEPLSADSAQTEPLRSDQR